MITTKEELMIFLENDEGKSKIELENNTFFENELLENPETGALFFTYYPREFVKSTLKRKYEKDYFTAIYEKMAEKKKMNKVNLIYDWTYEIIDAEGDGNHYFKDVNYIMELYKKDMEIIYLADEDVLLSQTFLEMAKDSLYAELSSKNELYSFDKKLLQAVKALKRADDLTEKLNSDNAERKRKKL